jgi:branched-chain amino acid aminotransferase
MTNIIITAEARKALEHYQLPQQITFGQHMVPIMLESDWSNGQWSQAVIKPYGKIQLSPTAKVLHYAQEIFEGLKAYKVNGNGPYLFRPEMNAKRFIRSGERVGIPELPVELFMQSVQVFTSLCRNFIPQKSGESLYLRPFIFATEESLGIKSSLTFKYMLIGSPSGAYIASDAMGVMIEREFSRASPGGTGWSKTGGNYAASLSSSKTAHAIGCLQTLWLDSQKKSYIEEMSGMNFMAVINNCIMTPALGDTILDGITRDSVIKLATHLGMTIKETPLLLDDVIKMIQSGQCTEAFACGTAAIISPIGKLVEKDGKSYALKQAPGPVALKLKQALLDIQEGRGNDPFGWRKIVD